RATSPAMTSPETSPALITIRKGQAEALIQVVVGVGDLAERRLDRSQPSLVARDRFLEVGKAVEQRERFSRAPDLDGWRPQHRAISRDLFGDARLCTHDRPGSNSQMTGDARLTGDGHVVAQHARPREAGLADDDAV